MCGYSPYMPTFDWIGKRGVLNCHREIALHLLRDDLPVTNKTTAGAGVIWCGAPIRSSLAAFWRHHDHL